jgi:hypothetical protein
MGYADDDEELPQGDIDPMKWAGAVLAIAACFLDIYVISKGLGPLLGEFFHARTLSDLQGGGSSLLTATKTVVFGGLPLVGGAMLLHFGSPKLSALVGAIAFLIAAACVVGAII